MNAVSDRGGWREIFDPFSQEVLVEPRDAYRRLREADPIHWSPPLKAWVMTRMEDVRAVLKDPEFEALKTSTVMSEVARRSGRNYDAIIRFLDNGLFFVSGEPHKRARRALVTVMNRFPLSELQPALVEMADDLVSRLPSDRRLDIVESFADPFPQLVMAHILGMPREDVPRLATLLAQATRVFDSADIKAMDAIEQGVREANSIVASRIVKAPADTGLGIIGRSLDTLEDAAATALFLYRVGSETTIGMAGLAFRTLMDRHDIVEQLSREPVLIPRFVGEVLRLESNVQRSIRVGGVDKRVGGRTIKAGERVLLLIGAANRDPASFETPDTLSLDRRQSDVAFGAGAHSCLGEALSRMEGRIAVERFLPLMPAVRDGEEEWYIGRSIRRLAKLPVVVQETV